MLQKIYNQIESIDCYKLAVRLTLLELILKPIGPWEIRVPLLILSIIALAIPQLLDNKIIWLLITVLTLSRIILDWPLSDNHAYLLSIWSFAIFMSCLIKNKDMLSKNARLMIGLVFIFAFKWKAFLSPDFTDSKFFELNMIEDPRFSEFTMLSCNVDSDDLLEFREYVKQHIDGSLINPEVSSFDLECLNKIAYFLSYYTLTIESVVAMLFLLPANLRITNYRDYFLILFCLSIYSVATVEGFGWLLISMGISQCDGSKKMKIIYLTSFLILLIYSQVPVFNILFGHH